MADDFPPSNPFRRKTAAPADAEPSLAFNPTSPDALLVSALSFDGSSASAHELAKLQTKVTKKVRLQSPLPSSPEDVSILHKPPAPIPRDDHLPPGANDPFDSDSDSPEASDDGTTTVTSNYIPANPFQKTLATMEHTEGSQEVWKPTSIGGGPKAGRASMDVDAFKRLLMTGSAEGAIGMVQIPVVQGTAHTSAINPQPPNISHHALNDGTSTDTSSISKQSLFEPIQENLPESPRTSHEISEPDDETRRLGADSFSSKIERKKPPPPSSKHGKLIRVELRDDNRSLGMESPALLAPKKSHQSLSSQPSPTDLNKPLPAAPRRTSHESDGESIFDVEAAGKRPEPLSPSSSLKRKTPPAPPLTRRHSQLVSDSKLNATSTGRLSPNFEEPTAFTENPLKTMSKAPPPPPARRPPSIRNSSSYDHSIGSSFMSTADADRTVKSPAPVPPPTRMSSKRLSGRPPSVHSMDMPSKRLSALPPPPPPRQRASSRTSLENPAFPPGPSRTSGESFRMSKEETRRGSQASQSDHVDNVDTESVPAAGTSAILADLAALQKEVDALRGATDQRKAG